MSALFGCFLGFRSNNYRGRTNCFTRQSERFRRKANELFSEAGKQNSLGHKIKTKLSVDTSNPMNNEPQSSKILERARTKNETKQLLEIGNKTSQIDVILPNNSWGLISELLLTQKLYYNCYKLINHMEDISIS